MASTSFYIDGFNLYHAIDGLNRPWLKWLNLKLLAQSYLRKGDELKRVCYFTSRMLYNPDKARRHKRYVDALTAVGVEVISSKFLSVDKYCNGYQRWCKFQEEKQTDVAMATTYLIDAMQNFTERIVLVTADSDQIPAVKAVRENRPLISIELAAPPGRLNQARELGALFETSPSEIKPGRLEGCLLPRTVYSDTGRVASTCPVEYTPPY
ncbi:MAG TPA: NYN domain-containing protein [Burkholderiales bacterium]|nr:NYN domain-containing protein [Burkholderiales bacterium]